MVRTQIQLTEDQAEALKRKAKEQDVSIAELIRRSIDLYIRSEKWPVSEEERREQMLSIIGMGRSGLTDLSTNHDYYLTEAYAETGNESAG